MNEQRQDFLLAWVMLIAGNLALWVWIPNDITSGVIETFRRQTFIGDALMPSIAMAVVVICALVMLIQLSLKKRDAALEASSELDSRSLVFLLVVMGLITVSLLMIFWAGAFVVEWFGEDSYRSLRDTAPWKYIGFSLGGLVMIWGLISLVEGCFKLSRLLVSVIAVAALILLFDVPFDNVLLPPNGDW